MNAKPPRPGEAGVPLAAPLTLRVGSGADAAQIAEATSAIWQDIEVALTPIIGQRGVAALFKRSLDVTTGTYPWVVGLEYDVDSVIGPEKLKSLLAQRSSADAAAGASALLQTFYDLLATLIGGSLTERLLRSVWGPPV
jgi:hypothetical protein